MESCPIKFRVWDKCLNKFISFDLIFHVDFDDKTYVFQQFTGMFDDQKREIYEGDIVEFSFPDTGISIITSIIRKNHQFKPVNLEWYEDMKWKIIGNIFENPELLLKK